MDELESVKANEIGCKYHVVFVPKEIDDGLLTEVRARGDRQGVCGESPLR